jgi:hypothetical protein
MTTPSNEPDDERTEDDIFSITAYEAPIRERKPFLPWHRPRKHFVRHEQWQLQIENLVNEVQVEQRTIRYLGLPGTDLLDIRHFHRTLCEPKDLMLRFLGFNTAAHPQDAAQTELNISLDEVRKMARIDPLSNVIADDFCLLADDSSLAWSHARDLGPFDVINLDLCDGFAKHQPGCLDNNHYNAVSKLMALQSGKKQPWLLFLTTRTGQQDINEAVLNTLIGKYGRNLAECPSFNEKSLAEFGIGNADQLLQAVKTPDGHLSVFLVGLCKWMIGIGVGQQPPFKVSVPSVHGYQVSPEATHNDLVSIAFRFDPTFAAATDPMGIARVEDARPSECQLATATVRRVKNRKCVDTILRDDPAIMSSMVEATAELLALARYDIEEFRAWLHTFQVAPPEASPMFEVPLLRQVE